MDINIIIDNTLTVDVEKLELLLNENTTFIKFKIYKNDLIWEEEYIEFPETHAGIFSLLSEEEQNSDYTFLFTEQPYGNNYFFEGYKNFVPFSFWDWDFLTNLPRENGILYFALYYLARELQHSDFRHNKNTGCIFDFLGQKRGVDDGMRQAIFCKKCLSALEKQIMSEDEQKTLIDVIELMNLLSNSSKWNKNILEKVKIETSKIKQKRKVLESGIINVVIASPSDLIEERELLINKLERKFRTDKHEQLCKHRLIVHGWEDLATQSGYAQDVINENIIVRMDIVLAIFKHKLGTPTTNQQTGEERAVSGTAEELLMALNNSGPLAMVYFYSKPPELSLEAENFDKISAEWKRLKVFKKDIQNKVLYKPFTDKEDLIQSVSEDILNNLLNLFEN